MDTDVPPSPADLRVTVLEAQVAKLLALVAGSRALLAERDATLEKLQRRIASLEKDSSNSSKPPSSDPPSAAKPAPEHPRRKRKPRIGRKRHQRVLIDADRLDLICVHKQPGLCPD